MMERSPVTIAILVIALATLWPAMVSLAGLAKATIGRTRPAIAEAISSALYWTTLVITVMAGAWMGGAFR
jgi:hypothetical protein